MSIALFWLLALTLYLVVAELGKHLWVPIVGQLLVAALAIPALLLLWAEPHAQLSATQLLAPAWLEFSYSFCFALLLGYILSDVIDLELNRDCLKIALPSFLVPLLSGIACAVWLLPESSWLSALAIGLLFSITAIPMLYLFLRSIDYPAQASKRLIHSAIVMDFLCWSLFALAQGSSEPTSLFWPLLAALLPIAFSYLKLPAPLYSLSFYALMLLFEHLQLNALLFGITYMLCMALRKQPFIQPLPRALHTRLLNWLAVPLILTYGVLQVDFHGLDQHLPVPLIVALIAVPIASKVLGSWLGLHWALPRTCTQIKWRESLLLNIRGLTEIVFLNLLLELQLIEPMVYFGLLLMSLLATLLPALLGRRAFHLPPGSRYEIS